MASVDITGAVHGALGTVWSVRNALGTVTSRARAIWEAEAGGAGPNWISESDVDGSIPGGEDGGAGQMESRKISSIFIWWSMEILACNSATCWDSRRQLVQSGAEVSDAMVWPSEVDVISVVMVVLWKENTMASKRVTEMQ